MTFNILSRIREACCDKRLCLETITVDEVFRATEEALKNEM